MFADLVTANGDWVLTIVRLILGIILFAHGAQKLLGWFGGAGFASTMRIFQEQLRLPYLVTLLVVLTEFLGGACLVLGLFSRLAAVGVGVTILGAIATVHHRYGLFMNWFGEKEGHGIEYHLLMLALVVVIVVKGGGAFSLDRAWSGHLLDVRTAICKCEGI